MSSSKKNWTAMFKATHPRPLDAAAMEAEEAKIPEPKMRWYPKQEQLAILESFFELGHTNPSKDEVKSIWERLLQYGDVSESSVFYWFQNRKSRDRTKAKKHKQPTSSSPPKKKRCARVSEPTVGQEIPQQNIPAQPAQLSIGTIISVEINGYQINVPYGSLNLWQMFGGKVGLVHNRIGVRVPIDDYGNTLAPLIPGESYSILV